MSLYSKVFNTLVTEGREATAKQMGAWFGASATTVAASTIFLLLLLPRQSLMCRHIY